MKHNFRYDRELLRFTCARCGLQAEDPSPRDASIEAWAAGLKSLHARLPACRPGPGHRCGTCGELGHNRRTCPAGTP